MGEYGKQVRCAKCGQVGGTLVKKGDEYVCQRTDVCEVRQRLIVSRGRLCSHWYCSEPAITECSCGALICSVHKLMFHHNKHEMKPLGGKDGS